MMRKRVIVRNISDGAEVHSFPVKPGADIDRVMAGMLINLDRERYYLDEEDFDDGKERYP